jgi:hypothetical protein
MKEIRLKELFYPFYWTNSWLYVSFVISVFLCFLLFFICPEEIKLGTIETDRGYKLFSLFIINWFPFVLIRFSNYFENVKSITFRGLLFLSSVLIIILFLGCAWPYAKYDKQKIDTYWYIFPFKNSLSIKIKTLFYKDINSIKWQSDDNGSDLLYLLNKGGSQSIAVAGASYKSRQLFHINLLNECNWLQNDFEEVYGYDYFKNIDINEIKYGKYSIITIVQYTLLIFGIIIQIICLLFYVFKTRHSAA